MTLSEASRELIQRHWALANARDWPAFAALLHPQLHYEVPQTREFLDSAEGYLDLFTTWPGAWRADLRELVAEGERAISVIDFVIGDTKETGISVFELDQGRIRRVTDHWPAPYEPPPRASAYLKRHPQPSP
jgi:hypothetical protein